MVNSPLTRQVPLTPPIPPTPHIPPVTASSPEDEKPDPRELLLSRQLQELTAKLGRLPTTNEAAGEISRDRTVIVSALRTLRLEAERHDRSATTTVRTQVESLSVYIEELRNETQRQGTLLLEQGRLIEAARDASWRHRRDLVNARLALAVLARFAQVKETETARYGELVRAIQGGHFAPVYRGLPEGQDGAIMAKLAAAGSVASAIDGIVTKERGGVGVKRVAIDARAAARSTLVAAQPGQR